MAQSGWVVVREQVGMRRGRRHRKIILFFPSLSTSSLRGVSATKQSRPSARQIWIASAFAKGFGGHVASLAMTAERAALLPLRALVECAQHRQRHRGDAGLDGRL